MKRFVPILLVLLLVAVAIPSFAQTNADLILLDDATPAIDVAIALPPDTTGTVALNFAHAAVSLTDEAGNIVFQASDARIHALELNIAPNSGQHTLHVERLNGASQAYVNVVALSELTMNSVAEFVSTNQISYFQEANLTLSAANPGGTVLVNLPNAEGVVTATFPAANATTQLVAADGVVIAESVGGHVDGVNFVLDSGQYQFTVLGSQLTDTVVAGVRSIPLSESDFTVIEAPAQTVMASANVAPVGECNATVLASSVNLRSGPGTGYSVLGYGFRNDTYAVGGRNPENSWVVVGTPSGSAWVAQDILQMSGTCTELAVFNVPFRDAQTAQLMLISPQTQANGSAYEEYDDDDEHEGYEHEEHDGYEHDDD